MNKRILVISDCHFPYHHEATFNFLRKLKKQYKPDTVVHIGDEMDWHSINVSHVINPDLPSPADELLVGRSLCQQLEKIFPNMKHIIETDKGRVMFAHQFSADISKAVQQSAMSCVQGHYHTVSSIKYVANDFHLNWGMSVGCLVDKKSLAMAYMKVNLAKPVLSCGVITEGIPYIVPMVLNNDGSWDNNIYL